MAFALPPLNLPGLTSIPPLQMSSAASTSLSQNGAAFMASGPGDWNVNISGTGAASGAGTSAASGLGTSATLGNGVDTSNPNHLLLIAVCVGAVWYLLKK